MGLNQYITSREITEAISESLCITVQSGKPSSSARFLRNLKNVKNCFAKICYLSLLLQYCQLDLTHKAQMLFVDTGVFSKVQFKLSTFLSKIQAWSEQTHLLWMLSGTRMMFHFSLEWGENNTLSSDDFIFYSISTFSFFFGEDGYISR